MKVNSVVHRYDNDIVAVTTKSQIQVMSINVYAGEFINVTLDETDFLWIKSFKDVLELPTDALYNDFKLTTQSNVQFTEFANILRRVRIANVTIDNPKF